MNHLVIINLLYLHYLIKNKMSISLIKHITYRVAIMFFVLIIATVTYGQSNHKNLRQGDKNYYQKDYLEAEEEYRKALQKNEKSVNANHNLGNSLYNQERYDEAAKHFESAALEATTDNEKAMSYHNLGNSYLSQMNAIGSPEQGQEVLQKSMDAYKQSLKHNPKDDATRYNLAFAQKLYQQFQQQQQQQQQQQNQEEQQQQQQQNPSSGGDDGDNQQNEDKEQPKPQPNQGESMTKEEAERLIKIMEEEERKVQEKMNKKKQQPNPNGKDW